MNADRAIRASTALVVVGIGGIAAYVSYRHALDVAQAHGETGATARLLPLTIDGLVYVASMVLLDSARRGGSAPALARWALALGIGATVAVNVLHGAGHGPVGAVISAWPAVCLVLAVELLMGMVRGGRELSPDHHAPGDLPAGRSMRGARISPAPEPPRERSEPAFKTAPAGAELNGGSVSADGSGTTLPDQLRERARDHFAETIAGGSVPSVRAIRQQLHVGHPRAKEVRLYLREIT
jgi:hypothetical protein